jgi:hypothetical protein
MIMKQIDKKKEKNLSRRDALKRMAGIAVIAPAITAFTASLTGCGLFGDDYSDYYDYHAYYNYSYGNYYGNSYSDYYVPYSNYYNYHSE